MLSPWGEAQAIYYCRLGPQHVVHHYPQGLILNNGRKLQDQRPGSSDVECCTRMSIIKWTTKASLSKTLGFVSKEIFLKWLENS